MKRENLHQPFEICFSELDESQLKEHDHTFFELVIHEMPLRDAENYVKEMRAFYTAGWMKIMGQ